jgi:hypothetical protein
MKAITEKQLEDLKVINALMWLQASIYAIDETETIKWFHSNQTKMNLKKTVDVVLKQHGKQINDLWSTPGDTIPEMTKRLDEFAKELTEFGFWMLPEITELIRTKKAEIEKVEIIKNA